MRYIILIVALLSALMAEKLTIGAGPYMQTQPYKENVSMIVTPSPVIFFDNSLIYVKWTRVGVYFLGDKQEDSAWGFSVTAQPRVNQYESSDSDYLNGMEDKENSVEGGIAFSASIDKAYIEIVAVTDVLARHDTWTLKAEAGYEFKFDTFTLYPSLIATYQSSAFMNYYYGVQQEESSLQRAQYSPGDGVQYGAQTYINYPLTENLAAFANIKAEKLPSEAINSPIVEDDYIFSGLVSLIYTFEY